MGGQMEDPLWLNVPHDCGHCLRVAKVRRMPVKIVGDLAEPPVNLAIYGQDVDFPAVTQHAAGEIRADESRGR